MKKISIVISALAVIVCSCSKEQDTRLFISNQDTNVVSFKAFFEGEDPETKLGINTSSRVLNWANGDAIAVQMTDNTFVPFTYSSSTKKFSATLGDKEVKDGGVAYYPASIANNGTPGSVNLPTSYTIGADATVCPPMIATVNLGAKALSLKHLGGILSVKVSYVPADANKLVLTVPGKTVTGTFAVTDATDDYISAGTGNSTVTLNFTEGVFSTTATEFFFPVPVTTFSGGFTVDFKNEANETLYTHSTAKTSIEAARASIKRMAELTVPKYVYLSTTNPWDGIVTTKLHLFSATKNNGWPGASASGSFTHNSGTYTRYSIDESMIGEDITLLFNGGDASASGGFGVEDFTRVSTSVSSVSSDIFCSINNVEQAKTKIYFRDNNGQQYGWEYNVYAWNTDNDDKLFGAWPGSGKSNDTYFDWSIIHDDVWYGMFEVNKNFKLGLIIKNPGNENKTNDIKFTCTASNYVVVTDNASGDPKTVQGFPTVSVSVE